MYGVPPLLGMEACPPLPPRCTWAPPPPTHLITSSCKCVQATVDAHRVLDRHQEQRPGLHSLVCWLREWSPHDPCE